MKKSIFATLLIPAIFCCISCSDLFGPGDESMATLKIGFADDFGRQTKADGIPDTGEFIITITSSKDGSTVWKGLYKESPEEFSLAEGNYTVSAESIEFEEPAYDSPQYGEIRVISLSAGQSAGVEFNCTQLNAGLAVDADAKFRTEYPNGELYFKSEQGTLMHSYTEKRTAYFQPGPVSLILEENGSSQVLCTRSLTARQMLKITLSANASGGASGSKGISVKVDTSRNWSCELVEIGGDGTESGMDTPLSIQQARQAANGSSIWVEGYIVGVATGTGKFSFEAPFSKETNIVLGSRSNTSDSESCLSVELPKGSVRDALNLVSNPSLTGRKIVIHGTASSAYYGIPGLKSPDEYMLKD